VCSLMTAENRLIQIRNNIIDKYRMRYIRFLKT